MTVKEQLKAALELFGEDGQNWVNNIEELRRPKHCAITAISEAARGIGNYDLMRELLIQALPEEDKSPSLGIGDWNDSHTYHEVEALFNRAIEAAS